MPAYKARSLYMGKGHSYSSECFQVCSDCGAAVFHGDTAKHTVWHEKMDELIEWAQHISKVIK